jgi:hypothetical protein
MDKQTEIMWEAEFVKQYPKPEDTRLRPRLASKELREASNAAIRARIHCLYISYNQNPTYIADQDLEKLQRIFPELRQSKSVTDCPWKIWNKECYDRFNAIFSAEPVYAIEELRKGNLLIEGNI